MTTNLFQHTHFFFTNRFRTGVEPERQSNIGIHFTEFPKSCHGNTQEGFRHKIKIFDIIIFSESLYYLDNINEISKVIDRYTQFLEVNGKIIISHYNYAQNINKIWKELDKKLIFIDQVEVANRFDLRSTIKVYDTP